MAFVARAALARRQRDLRARYLFIGNEAEEVADAIEACAPFVIGVDDVPGGLTDISVSEHGFFGFGVIFPADARFEIHFA